jgi:hypothetical protein
MNSASLCSLAGRYDNPIPARFLAPIDFLKIPAQASQPGGIGSLESIPGLLQSLQILAQDSFGIILGRQNKLLLFFHTPKLTEQEQNKIKILKSTAIEMQ